MRRLRSDFARIIVANLCVVLLTANVQKSTVRGDRLVDDDDDTRPNNSDELVDHREVFGSLHTSTDATTEEPPEGGVRGDDGAAAAAPEVPAATTTPGTMTNGLGLLSDKEADEIFHSHYNSTNEVDLVFVLDRSGSVPRAKWNSTVQFVMVCRQALFHTYRIDIQYVEIVDPLLHAHCRK